MVYSALRNVLGLIAHDIPNTAGYFRPVTVTAPPGTFVHPIAPAPVAARALGCIRIHQALLGAFAQMLPDEIYACTGGNEYGASLSGYDHSRVPPMGWVQLEFMVESAIGGFAYRDGQDAQVGGSASAAAIPVETTELEQPIMVEEFALIADSEGAGKFRGGLGIARQYRFLMEDSQIQMRCDRTKHGPYGLFGGEPAGTTRVSITADGKTRRMPGKFITRVDAGTVMRVEMPGAGGWGDPLERDPHLVLGDVIEEKVSRGRARAKYGVVIEPDGRTINWPATHRLRSRMANPSRVRSVQASTRRRPRSASRA
jgi:N-methylhydantoinase B